VGRGHRGILPWPLRNAPSATSGELWWIGKGAVCVKINNPLVSIALHASVRPHFPFFYFANRPELHL
jgi:hypothetical protein